MTKIQEKTKQNQSVFWILVHKALDKNDGQIFCLPVVLSILLSYVLAHFFFLVVNLIPNEDDLIPSGLSRSYLQQTSQNRDPWHGVWSALNIFDAGLLKSLHVK